MQFAHLATFQIANNPTFHSFATISTSLVLKKCLPILSTSRTPTNAPT